MAECIVEVCRIEKVRSAARDTHDVCVRGSAERPEYKASGGNPRRFFWDIRLR